MELTSIFSNEKTSDNHFSTPETWTMIGFTAIAAAVAIGLAAYSGGVRYEVIAFGGAFGAVFAWAVLFRKVSQSFARYEAERVDALRGFRDAISKAERIEKELEQLPDDGTIPAPTELKSKKRHVS